MDNNIKGLWTSIVRLAVKQARQVTDDQEALTIKCLYKQWGKQIGRVLQVGEYIQYKDRLYRVLQQHIVQENWIPGDGTESLYVVIDVEHKGTIDDPIPWNSNMECFLGKYYIEDGILYECIRDSGIALHFKASELVGDYFKIYNENIENNPEQEVPEIKEEPIEPEESIEIGTLENPIDVENMALPIAYELDKYYKEGNNVYKCIRSEILHFLPSSLVGHYFEII